jgi:hypothetical protein
MSQNNEAAVCSGEVDRAVEYQINSCIRNEFADLIGLNPIQFNRSVKPLEGDFELPASVKCPVCCRQMEIEEIPTTFMQTFSPTYPLPTNLILWRRDVIYSCVHGQSFKKWDVEPLLLTKFSVISMRIDNTVNTDPHPNQFTYSLVYEIN